MVNHRLFSGITYRYLNELICLRFRTKWQDLPISTRDRLRPTISCFFPTRQSKLRDQTVCPSPCWLPMPSRLRSLDQSVSSYRTDGSLYASLFLLQVRILRSWKASYLCFANKPIGGTLARANTALVKTIQLFWNIMVIKGTCPHQSCIQQLRVHHDRHQPFFRFSGSTNLENKPSQVRFALNGFSRCDLKVFDEAKPPIQLHSQILINVHAPRKRWRAGSNSWERVYPRTEVLPQLSRAQFRLVGTEYTDRLDSF